MCVGVSSLWLAMSAGVAWGYFAPAAFLIPIALLMGGTVVGIAYRGEKRCRWAAQHPQIWKTLILLIGMPIAYVLVINITKFTIVVEFVFLFVIACFLFIDRDSSKNPRASGIEGKLKHCC